MAPRLLLDEAVTNRLTSIDELKAQGLWFDTWAERAKERAKVMFLHDLYTQIQEGRTTHDLKPIEQQFLNNHPNINLFQTFSSEEDRYFRVLAAMAQHDITAYHEYINPTEVPAEHHRYMCNKMQDLESRKTKIILLSLPPGSAKSSYASKSFVQWYMGRNPTHKVLAGGYGMNFVCREFSIPNRETLKTADYLTIFPDISIDTSFRSSDLWALDGFGGRYTVRSVGANTSGIRANLIVLDDIVGGAESALSPKERRRAIQWLTADVFPRVLPGAVVLLIGTRWMSEDPMGYVEKMLIEHPDTMPSPYEIVNISAEGSEDHQFVKPGHWLWEEFYGAQHYINIKTTLTPALWSATYLGVPMDELGDYVEHGDFKYYDKLPKGDATVTITVDAAQKSTTGSNRTAIVAVARYKDKTSYVLEATAVQKPLFEIVSIIGKMAKTHGAHVILVEDAAMGSQIIENYSKAFICPVKPVSAQNKGSKAFNVESYLLPAIQSGSLIFPKKASWLADIVNEIVAFPNGKYDDYPDALSQYVRDNTKRRAYGAKPLSIHY